MPQDGGGCHGLSAFVKMPTMPAPPPRFALFLDRLRSALDGADLPACLAPELATLVAADDWLPPAYAVPGARYRQYLLWRCPAGRASVVSFVWDTGQGTPVHDHGVWGLVGILRGMEGEQRYRLGPGGPEALGPEARMTPGRVGLLVPGEDLHRVRNLATGVSVSIHVYGADIGTLVRGRYDGQGRRTGFVSSYANGAETPVFSP